MATFGSKFGLRDERLRLARFYAELSDGELQQLARDAGSLTDEASAALASEMVAPKDAAGDAGEAEDEDASAAEGEQPGFATC